MGKLFVGTTYVLDDEPCFGLFELNFEHRRHRIFQVIRGDNIAEYREDMGAAGEFKGIAQQRIMGGVVDGNKIYIEHTVGELRDIANAMRIRRLPFSKRELARANKIKEA